MANNKYKIVILGKNIYREYTVSDNDDNIVKIGTKKGCHIRFKKDIFFEDFSFEIVKGLDGWNIVSNDTVYFTTDGVIKLYTKSLMHGDEIIVKYDNFNEVLFKVNFFIDFDSVEKKYNREIDISSKRDITIGGNINDDIYIKDELLKGGSITLSFDKGEYLIKDNSSKYGVYLNAKKISRSAVMKEHDFLVIVGYYFYLKDNKLYTDINENININKLAFRDIISKNKLLYPKFNRNSRVKYIEPNLEVEVLPPEKLKDKPKGKIIMTLIPALSMLGLTILLRGVMGGGGSFVIYSVATMSIGIIMSIVTAIESKKEYKKEVEERKVKYLEYIKEKEEKIEIVRKKENEISNKIYIPCNEIIENINDFSKDLFDRKKEDEDYLKVRLGAGSLLANCKIKITHQEFKDTRDDLISLPEKVSEKYKIIDNMPIVINLNKCNAIGIVGKEIDLKNILTNLTLDLVGRHFYKDVKLFFMLKEDDIEQFKWVRWIKHVQNEELNIRNLIYDEESKNILFEYLYVELLKRESEINNNTNYNGVNFVIFVLDSKGIYNHPISRFIQNSNKYGVTFIFFECFEELLPIGCDEIVKLNNDNTGKIIKCSNGEETYDFKYDPVNDINLNDIALKLAPIFVEEVTLENELTKNISLFELLQIQTVDDLDIEKRWTNSMVYKSMRAPLGVKKKGEKVYLDLNEKNHGPHGLVAGTTGSGKSEILQSYILSMATLYHPYEIGFVIIDFKGGGMVNQFKDLPHLVGSITNIDGREITRSLLSIKAELRKRQELFREANVNHVDNYIKKFKNGEVTVPLPHLILIVDEFAELKSDQPEFMKELISAARIGRSLGVHLILATQKPSGVVDDQIWSNSKFKLCLKVQNQNDSNEVLKSPLAAEIKEPGRAYLQVGNNEIFELFQSAYSGAPAVNDEIGNSKEFEINEVNLWGKRKTVFKQVKKKSKGNVDTQLEVLVQYINEYCIDNNIKKLDGICLPPLENIINLEKGINIEKNTICTEVGIGIYDDPSRQLQGAVKLNLSDGNLFIVGSSQFGKTSLIQTIIRSIAENYSPSEVNIYILDFASMILKNFQSLNHVGGVVTISEDEKLKTFMSMMLKEIAERKSKLSKLGISSFTSYKEAGYSDIPHIVICLDNITAFKETYPDRDDELLNICREGVAVGITVIVANSQTTGIGYKYMSNFGNRIALYCNDSGEYSSLFDRCKLYPRNIPGRGIITLDKELFEYQTYLAFDGEKEIDRVKKMRNFIENNNLKYKNEKARIIPEIPEILDIQHIKENYKENYKKYEIPIGLDFENINLQKMNLLKLGCLSIVGKEGRGKSNFIRNIMERLQENILNSPVEAYVVDNMDKKLQFTNEYGFTNRYSLLYSELETIIEDIYEELEERSERVLEYGPEILDDEPLILIINNNKDAINNISNNKNIMDKYKKITTQFKNLKILFIFNDIDNIQVGFGAPELMRLIKENKKSIIFDNINEIKIFEIPLAISRNYKKELNKYEAYFIEDTSFKKIKNLMVKNQ